MNLSRRLVRLESLTAPTVRPAQPVVWFESLDEPDVMVCHPTGERRSLSEADRLPRRDIVVRYVNDWGDR